MVPVEAIRAEEAAVQRRCPVDGRATRMPDVRALICLMLLRAFLPADDSNSLADPASYPTDSPYYTPSDLPEAAYRITCRYGHGTTHNAPSNIRGPAHHCTPHSGCTLHCTHQEPSDRLHPGQALSKALSLPDPPLAYSVINLPSCKQSHNTFVVRDPSRMSRPGSLVG